MFNSLLTTTFSKYDADWANYPYPMVAELLRTGRLKIPELETEDASTLEGGDTEAIPGSVYSDSGQGREEPSTGDSDM